LNPQWAHLEKLVCISSWTLPSCVPVFRQNSPPLHKHPVRSNLPKPSPWTFSTTGRTSSLAALSLSHTPQPSPDFLLTNCFLSYFIQLLLISSIAINWLLFLFVEKWLFCFLFQTAQTLMLMNVGAYTYGSG
jgi:hypothetical protein